jgi:adenylate cyclase class 2
MREIEVKARLRDKETFLELAAKKGIVFGEPFTQEDDTYESEIPKDTSKWNIFRIRKQGNKTILTMKYAASSRSRDNHERETTIGSAEEVIGMLDRVGYTFGVRVRKTRQTAKYNDLELCMDEVEELGSFVEVEKLVGETADVDQIQTELWELLVSLSIGPNDRVHQGYASLMHEHLRTHPK